MPIKDPIRRKELQKSYNRKWYLKNTEAIKDRVYSYRKTAKDTFQEFKSTLRCEICGENRTACIEFHHVNGRPPGAYIEGVIGLKNLASTPKKCLEELKKCIPVCANCHRLIHAGELEAGECSKEWRESLQNFLGWFDSSRLCQDNPPYNRYVTFQDDGS